MTIDAAADDVAEAKPVTSDPLANHAANQPDKVALIEDQVGQPVRTITYAELNSYANRIANALLRAGVKAGEHVAWLGRNSARVGALAAGAGKAAGFPIPRNRRVTRAEAQTLLKAYDVVFVWASSELAGAFDGIEHDTAVRQVVVFGGDAPEGRLSAVEFLDGASDAQPPAPV